MAASSSHVQYNIPEFMSLLRQHRSSETEISFLMENFNCEMNDTKLPFSFSISLRTLEDMKRIIGQKEPNEEKIYSFISKFASQMPGFPGGGRSFVEVPLKGSYLDIEDILSMINKVVKKFRRMFKYDQNMTNLKENIIDTKNEPHVKRCFMTCLPETNAITSVDFFLRPNGDFMNLIIVVDSFWEPAVKAFCQTFEAAAEYCVLLQINKTHNVTNNGSETIYNDVVKMMTHAKKESTERPHEFVTPNIEYVELMSYIHRSSVITFLLKEFDKLWDKERDFFTNLKELKTKRFPVPSVMQETADRLGMSELCLGTKQVFISIIDPIYVHDAVHSTLKVQKVDDAPVLCMTKHEFDIDDFYSGNAFVLYGEHKGGFYLPQIKTCNQIDVITEPTQTKMASIKSHSNRQNRPYPRRFNHDFVYTSKAATEITDSDCVLPTDIFSFNWTQISTDTKTRTDEAFGLKVSVVAVDSDPEKKVPFQLYSEIIGQTPKNYTFRDAVVVESHIRDYLDRFHETHLEQLIFHMQPVSPVPQILSTIRSVVTMKSIETMTLDELVKSQITEESMELKSSGTVIISEQFRFRELNEYSRKHGITLEPTSQYYHFPDENSEFKRSYLLAKYTIPSPK